MPYNRPGPGVYVTNGGSTLTHGQPVLNANVRGVAVKQKTRSWQDGYSLQKTIDASEKFLIIDKGVVQVSNSGISGSVKGDLIYITTGNALTTASSGSNVSFGRIVEVAGERGTPTGKVRIDLDLKA